MNSKMVKCRMVLLTERENIDIADVDVAIG
jgi:hypothetical protein